MNKLYFVKFTSIHGTDQIVSLQTAHDEEQAKVKALALIVPKYQPLYKLAECTFICNTPDEVTNFEPC